MIRITELKKAFGKLQVLKGINLDLQSGSCISLIGPNASGKTTLLKCILGIVNPDEGQIDIAGQNALKGFLYRDLIGYMPQIANYPENMTVGQLVSLLKDIRGANSGYDNELFETFEIENLFNKPLRALSGGTRQKVSACIAFMFKTPILILDEPTAGLDPLSSEILKDKIRRETIKERTIIVTSHILSDLEEISTHIVFLHEGKIIFYETITEILQRTGDKNLSSAVAHIMKSSLHEKNN